MLNFSNIKTKDKTSAKIYVSDWMFHSHDAGQFEVQAEQMFNHPAYPGSNGMANDVALIQVPDLSQHANADSV